MRYLLLLLLLTACSPLAPIQVEPPELPENYLFESEPTEVLPERWWESFGDLQLNRLQEQLLQQNLDLRQALYRLEQLEALQRINAASLWPSLNLGASASRDKSSGSGEPILSSNQRISLAASYEVDLWKRLSDKVTAARLRAEAGQLEVQTLLLSLTANLAEQYFIAAEQRAQLQLVEGQIGHYHKLIDTIGERYKAGLAEAREYYQARQNLARAESVLPQFRTEIARAEHTIALLLGQLPQNDLTRIDQLPEITSVIDVGQPGDLLTRRPDIAAALNNLYAADRELAAAMADQLPKVNLNATLYYSWTQLARGDINGSFWSLALGLTQPLIDGGRRAAETDRQLALREESMLGYQKAILTAVKDVETALHAERNSAERQKWLLTQREASRKELDHSRANYRYGLLRSQDLLASEIRYLETSSLVLTSHRQWLSNRISLARALGGSWMNAELQQQRAALNMAQDGDSQ